MSFSERYGYKQARSAIQLEAMDEPLRNGLWSVLKVYCWDHVHRDPMYGRGYLTSNGNENLFRLCSSLWMDLFKKPLDTLNYDWDTTLESIRKYYFGCEWNEVYDFVEFVANNYERPAAHPRLVNSCNVLLERERSAYRFVGNIITRVTEEHEVAEIENAIQVSRGPVKDHIRRALEMMSDRKNPDFRNSIKESISGVESLVKVVLNEDKGTLGQLLKKLKDEIDLHPALEAAFGSLYGYTSDKGGIRHALMESADIDYADAKLMLVVCSTFINYVEEKLASKS